MNNRKERYSFLDKLNLTQDAKFRISRNLDRIVRGSDNVIMNPYLSRKSLSTILTEWDRIFKAKSRKLSKDLVDLEMDNRSKVGPRSVAVPWDERRSGVDDYFKNPKSKVQLSQKPPVPPRLRPLSIEKAATFLKNDTNSGLPSVTRKSAVKEFTMLNFDKLLFKRYPCVMFTRTQEDLKTRTVWGYPIVDTLNEMRYYRPLLELQRRMPWRAALNGPEDVDKQITNILNNAKGREIVSIDFSAYDASLSVGLIEEAFSYIKDHYQKEFHDELDFIKERFISIGLITPDGIMYGKHGVPSGSTFTNELDSIIQYLIAKEMKIPDTDMCIQGDDGVYITDNSTTLFDYFKSYSLKVNESKSKVSKTSVIYLQNLHSLDYQVDGICRGIYPTYRALGRILYPERFNDFGEDEIKGADFNSVRAITILENCRNHPLFEDLVKFIAKLDKYSLQFSEQGLQKYIKRISESYGVQGIFKYRYEDDVNGIANFKTVRLLSKFLKAGLA